MYISKFRIHNYKSYIDSTDVNLESGINIITGQNNAGKTALLQVLSLHFDDKPHKSTKTLSSKLEQLDPASLLDIEFNISKSEFSTYVFNYFKKFQIPKSHVPSHLYSDKQFFDIYLKDENTFQVTFLKKGSIKNVNLLQVNNDQSSINYSYNVNKTERTLQFASNIQGQSSFIEMINLFTQRIYFFHAERLNIGMAQFGENPILASNASNLPEVLNVLQGNPDRFARYNDFVKKIFPQIFQITVRPKSGSHVEIVVWNEDPKLEREDLLVPLSECGTGLGQVLAILYVVLTSDVPKIIVIDEPNSFLHPGASRKLIEILKEHPQHQFIISTHSPSTIAAANPRTINIVRTENAQSFVESIDVNETSQQQLYLAEIGAKLSDVFGADNILWVEGKTEEICFPKIIEATEGISLMGTSVLGVENTGDFNKNPELIFSIYEKLSKGKGLMPAAVGFVFDKEKLTETQIADLDRRSNNMVKFINRMMYENYLLNPIAIFNVLNNIDGIDVTQDMISDWIEKNKWEKHFISTRNAQGNVHSIWLQKVDGAKFLKALFKDVTGSKVQFDKIKHSVALTDWIIENSVDDLKELQDLLTGILIKNK